MTYAILEAGVCVNAIEAEEDYAAAIGAVPLPEGFWIGDSYDGETWHKGVPPSTEARVAALEAENHLLKEQVGALTERNGFHEDLIAEMASVVYG